MHESKRYISYRGDQQKKKEKKTLLHTLNKSLSPPTFSHRSNNVNWKFSNPYFNINLKREFRGVL